MSIRTRQPGMTVFRSPWRRRADQEWEMAGLAKKNGDTVAAQKHLSLAREYDDMARIEEGQSK